MKGAYQGGEWAYNGGMDKNPFQGRKGRIFYTSFLRRRVEMRYFTADFFLIKRKEENIDFVSFFIINKARERGYST